MVRLKVLVVLTIALTVFFLPIIPSNTLPENWKFREILNVSYGVSDGDTTYIPFKVKCPGTVYGNLSIEGSPLNIYIVDKRTLAIISGMPGPNETLVLEANSYVVIRGDDPKFHIVTSYREWNVMFETPESGEYYIVAISGENESKLAVQLYSVAYPMKNRFVSLYDILRC